MRMMWLYGKWCRSVRENNTDKIQGVLVFEGLRIPSLILAKLCRKREQPFIWEYGIEFCADIDECVPVSLKGENDVYKKKSQSSVKGLDFFLSF